MKAPRLAVFIRVCGCAGAQKTASFCLKWREGFNLSGGRIEDDVQDTGVMVRGSVGLAVLQG